MIKEEIKIYKDTQKVSEGFSNLLCKLLETYPHINIALSGGSTPKVLFDFWAKHDKDRLDWSRISFFWGDERCVPPTDDMSNYGMTKKHLFDKISDIPEQNIHRILGENNPGLEAVRYSDILSQEIPQKRGIPCFEIVMLGLGDDGHTVSIFPHQIDMWNSDKTCLVAEHPESGMKRVSLSGKVVNNAQYVIFLATGKSKAEKVRDIIKNREIFFDIYPAAKVNPTDGFLYWFLDDDAASLL